MNGYMRVAAAVPAVTVANPAANAKAIVALADRIKTDCGAQIIVMPEMSVTAYTCGDLFHNSQLIESAHAALWDILASTAANDALIAVGMPVMVDTVMYNCAVLICRGNIVAVVPKTYVPVYNEFYEKRWWQPADLSAQPRTITLLGQDVPFGTRQVIEYQGVKVGVEICEDLWTPVPASTQATLAGAEIVINLSASDTLAGKYSYIENLVRQQSARCLCAYVYASAGYGESTTDLVFDGIAMVAECGKTLAQAGRWEYKPRYAVADVDLMAIRRDRMHMTSWADCARNVMRGQQAYAVTGTDPLFANRPAAELTGLMRTIDPHPFVPADNNDLDRRCTEIVNIQSSGLMRRLDATHTRNLVVGISGGLDSTLALLVAVRAFDALGLDRKGIVGVTMPGYGTTGRTHDNAVALMTALGITQREISIVPAVEQHFRDIGHDPADHSVTYENAQARQRTYLLMDIANQVGGMVLGTGDLSELALGWATYNGDHMSMYGVNAGVPKTLVRYLVKWFAQTYKDISAVLMDVVDTPVSPELLPAKEDGSIDQKTEDLVGPYELHDFFLYYMLRYGFAPERIQFMARHAFEGVYDGETIDKWLHTFMRRFFAQQFKRSCLPDGPKVGSVSLSPRGDWRMPSDASSAAWL